jgi:hypothetical protein
MQTETATYTHCCSGIPLKKALDVRVRIFDWSIRAFTICKIRQNTTVKERKKRHEDGRPRSQNITCPEGNITLQPLP